MQILIFFLGFVNEFAGESFAFIFVDINISMILLF